VVAMLLGACAGPTMASKGTMQVYVTDAPPKGVTAIEIKASNVEAHMSGAADDQWVTLLKDPPVFDLVKATGVNVLLGTSDVAAGKYTQVRLDITDVTVTLNGKQVKATVPSDKLKLVGEITVEEGKKTPISLDFDAEESILLEGQDKVSLKPVVKLIVAKPGETLETPVAATAATPALAPAPAPTLNGSEIGGRKTPSALAPAPTPTPTTPDDQSKRSMTIPPPSALTPTPIKGEPVPGAEILVEQEPNDVPIKSVVTNDKGEFSFDFFFKAEQGTKSPGKVTLNLYITPAKSTAYQLSEGKTNMVTIEISEADGPHYEFTLKWIPDQIKSNRGGFAVSGHNMS